MQQEIHGKYVFAICGKRSVLEALSSPRQYAIKSLCIGKDRKHDEETTELLRLANRKSIRLEKMEPRELDKYAPGHFNHQGIVLLLKSAPMETSLEDILEEASRQPRYTVLALDSVSDHQNVGTLVRTAVALGFSAIIAPEHRSAPLIHPTVWRMSQGAAEHIHFVPVINLTRALTDLKEGGFWIAGGVGQGEGQDLRSVKDWPKKLCLVLGSEDMGMRRLTQETCDIKVNIPMMLRGRVDSLNISQAATIMMWEIFKAHPGK